MYGPGSRRARGVAPEVGDDERDQRRRAVLLLRRADWANIRHPATPCRGYYWGYFWHEHRSSPRQQRRSSPFTVPSDACGV